MVDRVLEALGAAHTADVGVLLADGTEPGPVYIDVGSGPYVPSTTEWHAYDGRVGRPRAAVLRGSCSCGWRGAAEYPLDWSTLPADRPLYEADIDLHGPISDTAAHLAVVGASTVQLPQELTRLVGELAGRLRGAAAEEPLVALKALADLRRVIAEIGEEAVYALTDQGVPIAEVAAALGTSEAAAVGYLRDYGHL